MICKDKYKLKGFTLIELIVVIAIIAILAAIIAPNAFKAIEKAKISKAIQDAKTLKTSAEAYYADIGFWPPDVPRGVDPGLAKPLPYNADTGVSFDPIISSTHNTHLPSNWRNIVTFKWDGPYIEAWPRNTPWGGKYDWNAWFLGANRYGVWIPPGCYVGIQGDYTNDNTIPEASEQILIEKGYDAGGNQLNGEVQLPIVQF